MYVTQYAEKQNHPNLSQLDVSKTCVKQPLSKRSKFDFQDQLLLNACQKHCRVLQGEHSAILLAFIKLPFVIKIFVLSFLSGRFTQVLLYMYLSPFDDVHILGTFGISGHLTMKVDT